MTTAMTRSHSPYVRIGRHRCARLRTLNLLDVENLVAGRVSDGTVKAMWHEFVDAVDLRWNDQCTAAVSARNAATAFLALPPGIRRVVGADRADGADIALIDSVDIGWVAAQFGQVVIASGDHIFASLANRLRDEGLDVVQVIGQGMCSAELYAACSSHRYLGKTRRRSAEWKAAPSFRRLPSLAGPPTDGAASVR